MAHANRLAILHDLARAAGFAGVTVGSRKAGRGYRYTIRQRGMVIDNVPIYTGTYEECVAWLGGYKFAGGERESSNSPS